MNNKQKAMKQETRSFMAEQFTHFYEHFTFGETDWSKRGKRLEKYVRVAIAIELVTVGTKLEDL